MYYKLLRVDVLVLDDFGLVPLSTRRAEGLYEIVRERYERKSIIVTSNRAPEEWAEVEVEVKGGDYSQPQTGDSAPPLPSVGSSSSGGYDEAKWG